MTLADTVTELDEAVGRMLEDGGGDNTAVLSAIFMVDNEIGELARQTGDPALKRLQTFVNEVAVAAKRLDKARLSEAMARVRATCPSASRSQAPGGRA